MTERLAWDRGCKSRRTAASNHDSSVRRCGVRNSRVETVTLAGPARLRRGEALILAVGMLEIVCQQPRLFRDGHRTGLLGRALSRPRGRRRRGLSFSIGGR